MLKKLTYPDSIIVVHNPVSMVMTIGKAMIVLPIIANLMFRGANKLETTVQKYAIIRPMQRINTIHL